VTKKQISLTIYIGITLALLGLMVYLALTMGPEIRQLAADSDQLRAYLNSFGSFGVMVFMLLHIFQVVVPAVPNELLQFTGGYVFGTWLGTLYTVAGIFMGSVIAFTLSRLVGLPLVRYLIPDKQFKRFEFIFKHKKSGLLVLILFFIPGLPKDLLTYLSGLTPVRPLTFILLTTIARLPGNFITTYLGANAIGGNINMVIVMVIMVTITLTTIFFNRQRLITWLSNRN